MSHLGCSPGDHPYVCISSAFLSSLFYFFRVSSPFQFLLVFTNILPVHLFLSIDGMFFCRFVLPIPLPPPLHSCCHSLVSVSCSCVPPVIILFAILFFILPPFFPPFLHVIDEQAARHGSYGMDMLVVVGTSVSYLYSTLSLFLACFLGQDSGLDGATSRPHLFLESPAMLLTFITLGTVRRAPGTALFCAAVILSLEE